MTMTVDVRETENSLHELAMMASTGSEIVLTENSKPVARIIATGRPSGQPRIAGLHRGAMQATEDFDKPLPDAFWTADP